MSTTILIIDDEANIRRMVGALLKAEGFTVAEAANGNAGLLAIPEVRPQLILLDLMMPPGPDGLATLEKIRATDAEIPVIMMSGKAQLADAVRAVQMGAFQFLEKPLAPESLLVAVRSAETLVRTQAENRALRAQLGPQPDLIGQSQVMRHVRELIAQVAPTDARVLILGDSGTGKELVANAIHRGSARAAGPFVSVNCAAIPRDLVESEMFGHERGAFTGATERRIGRFELADHGTLFLDEVGDLQLEAQAKLLRVLESGEIQRIGAERTRQVDIRVLAATNRRLEEAVASGAFREDLYFRLNVFPITIAPLRERIEDLPALVQHLAARLRPRRPPHFTDEALAALARHGWPGNIRELANIVERLTIIGGDEVTADLVPRVLTRSPALAGPANPPAAPAEAAGSSATDARPLTDRLDDYERRQISDALAAATGNIAEAARLLQTDRGNLYRRMRRLGIRGGGE
ncbi:MAG: sigma-54-dependent Fis family transcriptional regulator [Gemmatimonadetes bacterium]|nr:sigma-54-dependent Fis family transcriptional regulator [Gemmatimonadota bacterium]HPF62591.1 sigma-54 dependent transcriptional regulator [Gemmatimonadales bacterium]HRX19433.1 sigma-54 dependent transcriptional regulator [Gemmatimonadales bacterium]